MIFKPKSNASKRTKNRFREHTLVLGTQWEANNEPVTTIFKFGELRGKECISMQSEERDPHFTAWPRWAGWIPLNELEEIEGE